MLADLIVKSAEQFDQEDYRFSYRPSLLGPQKCLRQLAYQALGFDRAALPGRAILIFDDSSWHEELTVDKLRKTAYTIHSEQMHVDIPAGMTWLPERKCTAIINGKECGHTIPAGCLAGHIDWMLQDALGVDYLVEHKAINHFTFQKYWGGEIPWDYVAQVCAYMWGLWYISSTVKEAILLIKNKNTAQYIEFIISYDKELDRVTIIRRTFSTGETIEMGEVMDLFMETNFARFHKLQALVAGKTLPKREYSWGDWQCDYCGWCVTCYENYEKEFTEEMKTEEFLPSDFADMVRYWKEATAQRLSMEKEEEKLKAMILSQMKESKIRSGISGDYILEIELRKYTRYDTNALPESVKQTIKKETFSEVLKARKAKIKEAIKDKVAHQTEEV